MVSSLVGAVDDSGDDAGRAVAGRQVGVPTLAASQGRAQAAEAEGLGVALLGNIFGFVGAAFVE
ncbi:hypothetical protein [Mycolicibacter sinensis]